MKQKLILLVLGVFLGIGTTTFWLLSRNLNFEDIEHGKKLQTARPLENIKLTDLDGAPFTLENFKEKWTLLTFGFTNCPDVCPTALAAFRDELNLLEDDRHRIQFAFVTVDPERDTIPVLKEYIKYFHASIIGLHSDLESTKAFAENFGVFFEKKGDGPDYSMAHSPQFFLIDPEGQLAAMYSPPLTRGKIAMDLSRVSNRESL